MCSHTDRWGKSSAHFQRLVRRLGISAKLMRSEEDCFRLFPARRGVDVERQSLRSADQPRNPPSIYPDKACLFGVMLAKRLRSELDSDTLCHVYDRLSAVGGLLGPVPDRSLS